MGNYTLDLVTAPITEPITVTEVKNNLRIEHNVDNTLIGFLITAARTSAEVYTRRSFMTQTWKMYMDTFSGYSDNYPWFSNSGAVSALSYSAPNFIETPLAPLQSITHLKTYDDSDVATTFSSSSYYVSSPSGDFARPGSITLRTSATWPIAERVKDAIEIQFVAGYGDEACDVPQQIRMAIQEEVSYLYQNKGSCESGTVNSGLARSLLSQFKVMKL